VGCSALERQLRQPTRKIKPVVGLSDSWRKPQNQIDGPGEIRACLRRSLSPE
jgi:hypothetical protein